jgi:phosphoribosylformylglycinamidine (FGAM) synthase-like amidotransferase family enzyme
MMPHPERASEPELGCTDGMKIFESMVRVGVEAGVMAAK